MYAAVLVRSNLIVHRNCAALLCRDCVGLGYWVTLPHSQLIGGGYGYGLGSRVLQAEPLFECAIDSILPGGSFREVPVRVRGVGPDHVVAPGPVVGGEPLVVEIHGALGHHRLVRFQIQTHVLPIPYLVSRLEVLARMGSCLSSYELLPQALHHVVELEVGLGATRVEYGYVLVEFLKRVAFCEIPLVIRGNGSYGVGASRPYPVVVEVYRALGHEVGAIGQDLE